MTTLKKINARLPDGIELVKGEGYFYVTPVEHNVSVYVYRLNDLTEDEWIRAIEIEHAGNEEEGR